MARAAASGCARGNQAVYRRHRPEETVLFQTIERYWPEFRERAEQAGGLPAFVVREVEAYLRCGRLEDEHPALASCYGAAARGIDLCGQRAGQPTLRIVDPLAGRPNEPVALVAGFNVHAKLVVDGRDRHRRPSTQTVGVAAQACVDSASLRRPPWTSSS